MDKAVESLAPFLTEFAKLDGYNVWRRSLEPKLRTGKLTTTDEGEVKREPILLSWIIPRVLSADQAIDSTPMDVFSRLRDWERTGLLEKITLTVKRLHRHASDDGEAEDAIVTYDQLSDGEQMLLCHTGLLNSTAANVIVATHTSIALTDAFAAEVTVLDKKPGKITARRVKGGLFGTDPGEVNMNLFGADSSIGRRSVELLDQLLKTEWKDREGELEEILDVLGSSFHRAELRAVLKQLRAKNDGSASN